MEKKHYKFFLTMLLLFATIAAHAYDFKVGSVYYYKTSDTEVCVTNNDELFHCYSGSIKIPATVSYGGVTYSVTSIGSDCFRWCTGLTSVTIPNSVTSIGERAFHECQSLTSVTIPNSVTSIERGTFNDCYSLTSVIIPNSVTSIGPAAFYYCYALTSVTIGNSVTSIDGSAFEYCSGLKTIINLSNLNITKGSSEYGYVAYYADKVINGSDKIVDGDFLYSDAEKTNLFRYLGDAVGFEIPNSVKEIENECFAGNTTLTSLRIGSNVQKIGTNAFKGCPSLVKVFITANTKPEGIESAFDNVTGRQTYVANNNYDGIKTLGTININSNLSSMFAVNGVKYIPISMSARTCEAVDATYAAENTEISIDQTVSYRNIAFKVPSVKPHVLRNNSYVKSLNVNIANNVPDYAFAGCDQLTTVTIGENVTELSTGCFDGDSELQTVNISDRETALSLSTNTFRSGKLAQLHLGRDLSYTVGNDAMTYSPFSSIATLQQVEIGEKVKEIGDYAFAGCEALNKFSNTSQYTLLISPSITRIGAHAFDGVKEIQNITIEASSTPIEIGSGVFSNSGVRNLYVGRDIKCDALPQPFADCAELEELEFAKDVTTINEYAYTNTAIKTLTLPEKTAVLSAGAFYKCGNLTSVTIPECVTTIGEKCFGESGLLSVEIGKNVETIGNSAFENSKQLTYVSVAAESIGNSAFAGCSKLQEAVLNDRCKSIGSGAFKECAALTKINIPTGNTVIDEKVFANCSTLTEIVLPESITAINNSAFNGTALTSLIIPAAVTTIGNTAFANTKNLATVVFNAGKDAVNVANNAFDGMGVQTLTLNRQLDYNTSGKSPLSDNNTLTNVEMDDQPTSLLKGMFKGCTALRLVKVGGNVKTIEESAFEGCSSLTSVIIPKSVTSVGEYVFANTGIQSFEAESTLEHIGLGTFNGCKSLKSFVAKSGSKTLELGYNASNKGMFADCPLETVNIDRPISYDTQAAKGYSPFYRSTTLKSVTMGNNPASIPANMFYGCSALSDVAIGNGVTSIGDYAFSGCISLKDFSFGRSVKTIGNEAFSDCTALTRLVSKASVPPTCGSQALEDIDKWECTLYVPEESNAAYLAANQWMDFFFVETFVDRIEGDIDGDGELTKSDAINIMNAFLGDESVDITLADVNGDGKVTMADANAILNISLGNFPVSELSLNETSLSLTITTQQQLTASVKPYNATNKEVEWTTSNSNVATVSNTGLVAAVGVGECIITCTAKDGSGVKAECQVKVEEGTNYQLVLNKYIIGDDGQYYQMLKQQSGEGNEIPTVSDIDKEYLDPNVTFNDGDMFVVTCYSSRNTSNLLCRQPNRSNRLGSEVPATEDISDYVWVAEEYNGKILWHTVSGWYIPKESYGIKDLYLTQNKDNAAGISTMVEQQSYFHIYPTDEGNNSHLNNLYGANYYNFLSCTVGTLDGNGKYMIRRVNFVTVEYKQGELLPSEYIESNDTEKQGDLFYHKWYRTYTLPNGTTVVNKEDYLLHNKT